ncbi:GmrSD restriction endonuclease domain-containing protein [Mycoplasmopsis lipofaciens]|uniref:GmrSD restriction endonuclease domain-containing protein n=1 Tax=Mycoplasmopsis lipofaciens TaxID=114884 RepID=UPI0004859210|nr:DUF262 domain-containing protein [Mycoplasmopsis lipofaciens]
MENKISVDKLKKMVKNANVFDFWKIGTNVKTYIDKGINIWMQSSDFVTYISQKYTPNKPIIKNEANKEMEFQYNFNNGNLKVYETSTTALATKRQFLEIYEYLGILKSEGENNYALSRDMFNAIINYKGKILNIVEPNDLSIWHPILKRTIVDEVVNKIKKFKQFIKFIIKKTNDDDFDDNDDENVINEKRLDEEETGNEFETTASLLYLFAKKLGDSSFMSMIIDYSDASNIDDQVTFFEKLVEYLLEDDKNVHDIQNELEGFKKLLREDEIIENRDIAYNAISDDINRELNLNFLSLKNKGESFSSIAYSIFEYLQKIRDTWEINVPIFQRNYVWNEAYIETLINDIDEFIDKDEDNYYYLGSILLSFEKRNVNSGFHKIIDGQQRTTTILLICFALYKLLAKYGIREEFLYSLFEKNNNGVCKIISKFQSLEDSVSYKKIKLLFSDDKEKIIEEFKNVKDDKEKIIQRNYIFIIDTLKEKINANKEEGIMWLEKFTETFLTRFCIVTTIMQTDRDFLYYQKLNLLSKPLTDIELLKSRFYNVFYKKYKEQDKTSKKVSDLMNKFENDFALEFEGKKGEKQLEYFARNLSFFFNGKYYVGAKTVATKFSKVYLMCNEIIESFERKDYSAEEILNTFINFSRKVSLLYTKPNHSKSKFTFNKTLEKLNIHYNNKEILSSLMPHIQAIINNGKTTIFIPVVMAILERFNLFSNTYRGGKTSEVFNLVQGLLFEIERFNFFWKTSFFSGESLSLKMFELAKAILENKNNCTQNAQNLRREINNMQKIVRLDQSSNKQVYIDLMKQYGYDTKDIDTVKITNNEYTQILLRVQWFLNNNLKMVPKYELDLHKAKRFKNDYFGDIQYSYEHMESKDRAKKDLDNISVEYVKLIGNGMLVSKKGNSTQGAKTFKEKNDKYKKAFTSDNCLYYGYSNNESNEPLLDNVCNWESIDEPKIKNRNEQLIELIYKMYKIKED